MFDLREEDGDPDIRESFLLKIDLTLTDKTFSLKRGVCMYKSLTCSDWTQMLLTLIFLT